jgi:hypothetical protein
MNAPYFTGKGSALSMLLPCQNRAADRKAKALEEKLREKDNVIAELASPTALALPE